MYNAKYIIPGLGIFLAVATLPFWYNAATGSAAERPAINPMSNASQCILPATEMREKHMQLLNTWRDEVVREGRRIYTATDGTQFQKSLSGGCLQCHESKAEFCDKCHAYAGAEPNCWQCHVDSTAKGNGI